MSTIAELLVKIGADTKGFSTGLKEAGNETKGFGGKVMGAAGTVAKGTLLMGGAIAGTTAAGFAMVNKLTSGYDDIAKGAQKLGVATDTYQIMDYWAGQNGLSHATAERSLGRFNQRIGLAEAGNEKYAKALKALNVDTKAVRDGTLSTDDAYAQAISTLSNMENETEKVTLATEMFGTKLAREMLPALQDGSLSFEEAGQKAREMGIIVDGETLAAAEAFQDTWDDLTRTLGAFGREILEGLMPIFQSLMDWVLDNMPEIKETFSVVFDAIGAIFEWFYGVIQDTVSFLSDFKDDNSEIFTSIRDTISQIIETIWNIIQDVWNWIVDFWNEHGQEILDNTKRIFKSIWETIETVLDIVKDIFDEVMSWIVPFVEKMLAKLFDFWDENGEKIMDAVDVLMEFVISTWEFIRDTILPVVEYLWNQVSALFETAIDVVLGLVDVFASLLTGDFEGAKDALIGIVKSLWDGIKNLFANAWSFISEPLSNLWDKINGWFTGLIDDAFNWGKNMIDGFINGIKNMGSKVKDAAKGVMGGIGSFLGFNSPADEGEGRHIVDWGANMVDGFVDGMKSELKNVGQVANQVAGHAIPQANVSGHGGVGGTQNIQVMLDGRVITQAVAPRMVRDIKLKTGYAQ